MVLVLDPGPLEPIRPAGSYCNYTIMQKKKNHHFYCWLYKMNHAFFFVNIKAFSRSYNPPCSCQAKEYLIAFLWAERGLS